MKIEQIIGLQEAKKVLNIELTLRAVKDQPQKMLLFEGASGCAKTTLIELMVKTYMEKYSNRFEYKYLNPFDVTAHVTTTSEKIHNFFYDVRRTMKPTIIFIDEADEILGSRLDAGIIKTERTNSIMRELNTEILSS